MIRWTGKRSVASGGTRVNIDGLDVTGNLAPAATAAPTPPTDHSDPFQQTDGRIAYTGTWVNFAAAALPAALPLRDSAASATIYFNGTRLDWIATKGVTMGLATVSLDGAAPLTVEPLQRDSPPPEDRVVDRDPGPGAPQAGDPLDRATRVTSGGTRVNIDALDVVGVLTQGSN